MPCFLALYWQATGYPFLNFLENAALLHPEIAENQSPAWAFSFAQPWQPVAWLSHMTDFALFGVKAGVHKTVSLLWHVLNVLLVFAAFRRLTGAFGTSLVTALLWGLHPLRVEPVVWLVERRMLLATSFTLLALLAYPGVIEHPRVWWRRVLLYLPALLAALSHPVGAALPVLLLAIDRWPLERATPLVARVIEKWPLWIVTAATIALVARAAAQPDTSWLLGVAGTGQRIQGALLALLVAAPGKTILPYPLSALYWNGPGVVEFIGAALFFGGIALYRRTMLPGLLWFAAALLPTLGWLHPEIAAWGDRGTYLAHIGLIAAAVFTAVEFGSAARTIALILGLLWAGLSWARIPAWQSTESALRASIDQGGGHPLGRYLLAQALIAQNQGAAAEQELRKVLEQRPRAIEARLLLGSALALQRKFQEGADVYREVIRQAPNRSEGYYGLGMMQTNLQEVLPAIENFGEAIKRGMAPTQEATAENAIALYWISQKNWAQAEQHSRRAWQLVPAFANAHRNYATALARQNRARQAFAHIERARLWSKEDPQVVEVWAELYNHLALEEKKRADEEKAAQEKKKN